MAEFVTMDSPTSTRETSPSISIFTTACESWPIYPRKRPAPIYPMRPLASNPVFHPLFGPVPVASLNITPTTAGSIIRAIEEYQNSMSFWNLAKDLSAPPTQADIDDLFNHLSYLFQSFLNIIPEEQQAEGHKFHSILAHLSKTINNVTSIVPLKQKYGPYPPQKVLIYRNAIENTDMKLKLLKDMASGCIFLESSNQHDEVEDLLQSLTAPLSATIVSEGRGGSGTGSTKSYTVSISRSGCIPGRGDTRVEVSRMNVGSNVGTENLYPSVFSDTTASGASSDTANHILESADLEDEDRSLTGGIIETLGEPVSISINTDSITTEQEPSDGNDNEEQTAHQNLAQNLEHIPRQAQTSRQTFALAAAHIAMGNLSSSLLSWRRSKAPSQKV